MVGFLYCILSQNFNTELLFFLTPKEHVFLGTQIHFNIRLSKTTWKRRKELKNYHCTWKPNINDVGIYLYPYSLQLGQIIKYWHQFQRKVGNAIKICCFLRVSWLINCHRIRNGHGINPSGWKCLTVTKLARDFPITPEKEPSMEKRKDYHGKPYLEFWCHYKLSILFVILFIITT